MSTLQNTFKMTAFASMALISQLSFGQNSNQQVAVTSKSSPRLPAIFSSKFSFKSEKISFFQALKELSNHTSLNFYVDDMPKEERLKLRLNGDVKSALDELCDNSDYFWKFVKPDQIILSRRWKDPVVFPSISLDEMRMAVKNVLSIIPESDYLSGDKGGMPGLSSLLYASLSSQQVNALISDEAIGFNDLTPLQKKLFDGTMIGLKYHNYFDGWRELEWRLNHLQESYFFGVLITRPDFPWKYQLHWACPSSPVSKQNGNDENFLVRPFNDTFQNLPLPAIVPHSPEVISLTRPKGDDKSKFDLLKTKFDCVFQNASLIDLITELSKVTGLIIKAEKPIFEHRFSVHARGLTIPDLLDLIRRPHHWIWTRVKDQEIYLRFQRLDRYKELVVSNIVNLRETLGQSLPLSLASFMGLEIDEVQAIGLKEPILDLDVSRTKYLASLPWQHNAVVAINRRAYPAGSKDTELCKKLFFRFPVELALPDEKTLQTKLPYAKMSEHDKSILPELVLRHSMGRMGGFLPNTWLYPGGDYLQIKKNIEEMFLTISLDKDKQPNLLNFHTGKPNKDFPAGSMLFGRGLTPAMRELTEDQKRILQKLSE